MPRARDLPVELTTHLPTLADICRRFEVDLLILYGSRARGYARPESDYDFGALFNGTIPDSTAVLNLHREFQKVLSTSRIDLAILNRASPLLHFEVARTGIPLVEAKAGAFSKFCVRAVQRHNDGKIFYEAERKYLLRRYGVTAKSGNPAGKVPD